MRSAMCSPIAWHLARPRPHCSTQRVVDLDRGSMIRSTWMKESPRARGICAFTWAMTTRAACAAALVTSTLDAEAAEAVLVGRRDLDDGDVDREDPFRKSRGISERKIGM